MEKKKFIQQLESFLNEHPYLVVNFHSNSKEVSYNENASNFKIKVGITKLIAECQIEINATPFGLRILINEEYPNLLIRTNRKRKTFDILMALFFFHELTHLTEQNLGMKHNVTEIRKLLITGELSLLHFDIQADRKAAILTKDMFPFLSEVEIAGMQSQSLEDFPAERKRSQNSIFRKNLRFVASRLHYVFLRQDFFSWELKNPFNFLSATWWRNQQSNNDDFTFLITMYGIMKHLGVAKISKEQINFLDSVTFKAKSSKEKFKKLDALLSEIISNLHLGGGYVYRNLQLDERIILGGDAIS